MHNLRQKKFQCPKCSKKYSVKSTLVRHIKYECGKEPMFGCPKCSYRGYQKTHVIKHMLGIHSLVWESQADNVLVFK